MKCFHWSVSLSWWKSFAVVFVLSMVGALDVALRTALKTDDFESNVGRSCNIQGAALVTRMLF